MSQTPIRKNNSRALVVRHQQLPSQKDRALQTQIETLRSGRKRMADLDKWLRNALDLPKDKRRSGAARVLRALVPKFMFEHLPDSLMEMVAEEEDVLEFIEHNMRNNIDTIQSAMVELGTEAASKKEELEGLAEDIVKAEDEDWSAQELQQYMADRAQITLYAEVARLLDEEFKLLTPEECDRRKQDLLEQLKNTVDLGKSLTRTMGEVCFAGLEVFSKATHQYHAYMTVYRPIAVMRDAAKTLLETDNTMYVAREALEATFQESLQAISDAVDAANAVDRYAIASADVTGLLEEGKTRLQQKRLQLHGGAPGNTPALPAPKDKEQNDTETETN